MATPLEEKNSRRLKYLHHLYEISDGRENYAVNLWKVGEDLDFSREESEAICDYLEGEQLVERERWWSGPLLGGGPYSGPWVCLTHDGIKQVETAVSKSVKRGTSMRVFISHSSEDSGIASALIDLLRAALNLSASDIRCTSVDGYGLQGGISTDERLRSEVHDAEVFIGLVSQHSMASAYVVFELGARWGSGKRLIPLLKPGTAPSILGGPLHGIHALSCNSTGQLHQLVSEIGQALRIQPDAAAAYQDKIERVINCKGGAG